MKKRKIIYSTFAIILFILSIVCYYYIYYFNNIRDEKLYTNRLLITNDYSTSYVINNKDGSFYNSESTKDVYDLNNINDINVFFNYSSAFDKSVTGTYSYYVIGKFEGIDSNIYESNEYKYDINDSKLINVDYLLNINMKDLLNSYNNYMGKTTKAIYTIYINYQVYNSEISKYVSNSKNLQITINLDGTNSIDVNKSEIVKDFEYATDTYNDNIYVVIILEFLGAALLFDLVSISLLVSIEPKENIYRRDLNKILRLYKDRLIKLSFIPDLSNKEVIFVDDFNGLISASDTLHVPIDYIEIVKDRETVFMVIISRFAYVYKVSIKKD